MAGLVARYSVPSATVVRTRTDIDPPKSHAINRFVHHHWTDHLIVSSQSHKRICRDLLDYPMESIDVIYGAVDTREFTPENAKTSLFRREIGVSPETVLIGMVARLDPVKGHEYALDALRLLESSLHTSRFVFLGYENQRTFSWLMEQASARGIADRVIHFGWRDDLSNVVAGMDIGLISSVGSEANCRVALEFMASGKPLVATTVGVIPEIFIDGEQGFLVPPRQPAPMASALSRLLSNPPLRLRMGRQALEHVRTNFNLDFFTTRTEQVYQKALNHKRQSLKESQS